MLISSPDVLTGDRFRKRSTNVFCNFLRFNLTLVSKQNFHQSIEMLRMKFSKEKYSQNPMLPQLPAIRYLRNKFSITSGIFDLTLIRNFSHRKR